MFEMQSLGADARYVQIDGGGKNAADFHIAFYMGVLSRSDPGDRIHIVSRDKGFDPLVRHLVSMDIKAARVRDLYEIPWLHNNGEAASRDEMLDKIIRNFDLRGSSRPRRTRTLKASIRSLFGDRPADELDVLVRGLEERKYVAIEGDAVKYPARGSPSR